MKTISLCVVGVVLFFTCVFYILHFYMWMLRPARVVTGCMCAAVSCQATQMGLMLKKKRRQHIHHTDTSQSSNSTDRTTSLWVLCGSAHCQGLLYMHTQQLRWQPWWTVYQSVCERVHCFGLKLQLQQGGSMTKRESCCWGVQQPAVERGRGV